MADDQKQETGRPGQPPRYMRMPEIQDNLAVTDGATIERQAKEWERIKNQHSRKLTPEAKAYIVELIVEGNSNKSINEKLRLSAYLSSESPDLGESTLTRLRSLKAARRDSSLLDLEAQQIAHAALSRTVKYYAEIMDLCFRALTSDEAVPGLIGNPDTRVSELRSLMADATKLMYSWHAKDIAAYTSSIGNDEKAIAQDGISQIAIVDSMIAALIREQMAMHRRRYEAAGIKVPDFSKKPHDEPGAGQVSGLN